MTTTTLDTRGRLVEFDAVPRQRDPDEKTPAPAPDWRPLFQLAELSETAFAPAAPAWTPRTYADTRAAWVGRIPELGSAEVRLEAAAYRGARHVLRHRGSVVAGEPAWSPSPSMPRSGRSAWSRGSS